MGREGELNAFGNNHVSNLRGHLVADAPDGEEMLLVADVDLNEVRRYRAEVPYLGDRRPDTYGTCVGRWLIGPFF